MSSIVYLNGEFLEKSEAKISVLDRGFIFADGVYEVMPVYNRYIFRLSEHLERLQKSLNAIHIVNPHSIAEWQSILQSLVERNPERDQSLYLQITRGVAERDHIFDDNMMPTVFAMSRPLNKRQADQGISAITHEDIRWKFCDIKSIALLPGVLLRYEAHKEGGKEAILIKDGFLTEGAASNVFIVKDEHIKTPEKNHRLLSGITRDLVIELAQKHHLPCSETDVTEAELFTADEIWVTSSTQEIIPVTILDSKPVGSGEIGSIWRKMNSIYQTFKQEFSGEDL